MRTEPASGQTDVQTIDMHDHVAFDDTLEVSNTVQGMGNVGNFQLYGIPKKDEIYESYVLQMHVQNGGKPLE